MTPPFAVTVSQRPEVQLYGISVKTDISRAARDCALLWERDFLPRMHEISGRAGEAYQGASYGVCVMADPHDVAFDYWAAMPPADEALPCPPGMGRLTLPGGFYASCTVHGLDRLGEGYNYLYTVWARARGGHAPDMSAPCFELYDNRYPDYGAVEIFMPVLSAKAVRD